MQAEITKVFTWFEEHGSGLQIGHCVDRIDAKRAVRNILRQRGVTNLSPSNFTADRLLVGTLSKTDLSHYIEYDARKFYLMSEHERRVAMIDVDNYYRSHW